MKVCTESLAPDDRFDGSLGMNILREITPVLFKSSFWRSWLHRYIYKPKPLLGKFHQAKKLSAYPGRLLALPPPMPPPPSVEEHITL